MPSELHLNTERGHLNHGWLKTAHSFSFAHYVNSARMNFGALLVLNEDTIQPNQGFGEHFHDNMEIITIPLSGALEHHDSMGNGSVIRAGDVQIMSAGTGIMHSEKNPSTDEPVHLLQLWIIPNQQDLPTRYEQMAFDPTRFHNAFTTIASGETSPQHLKIHQDARIQRGNFDAGTEFNLEQTKKEHGTFLFVIEGSVEINGQTLSSGDAFTVWNEGGIHGTTIANSKLLAIEVPMTLQ